MCNFFNEKETNKIFIYYFFHIFAQLIFGLWAAWGLIYFTLWVFFVNFALFSPKSPSNKVKYKSIYCQLHPITMMYHKHSSSWWGANPCFCCVKKSCWFVNAPISKFLFSKERAAPMNVLTCHKRVNKKSSGQTLNCLFFYLYVGW